ncbi:MAG: D-glycerate dehydrogenase [Betaproteobacteria bacterium]|nr:D-glycerate dehydrogenase [Betaproteobacteria bacterium]
MKPRLYLTQPVAPSAMERLRAAARIDFNPDPLHIATRDELLSAARDHDVIFCLLHDKLDREVIAAGTALRLIASMTITPADIDVAEATRRRIPVTTIPALMLDEPTADLAWSLLLAVARRTAEGDRMLRSGIFPGSQSCYLEGAAVSGKRLGIVGMGGVGRAAARRAQGFAMPVLYHDPRRLTAEEERSLALTWVEFDELLRRADFVSIHSRLTPATRHLFGAREFALMKPTAFLINTARGPIVDEAALVHALERRTIAGAGLDVYENEPRPHAKLLTLPNVVMTPHIGSAIGELRDAMANVVVDNILAVLDGRRPPNCWNPEIYGADA